MWVYGVPSPDIDMRRAELLAHLETWVVAQNRNRPIWPEKRYQLTSQVETSQHYAYEHVEVRIEKVAYLLSPALSFVRPIHIMVTDAYSPGEILQGFDVSTHAVAIESTGRIWKRVGWTPPQVPPVALLNNSNTPERMARIAARFAPATTEGVPF